MTSEAISQIFCFALLAGIVIWREVFHAARENALLDRIMSRNIGELAQVEAFRKRKPESVREKKLDETDDYAAAQADKANALFVG